MKKFILSAAFLSILSFQASAEVVAISGVDSSYSKADIEKAWKGKLNVKLIKNEDRNKEFFGKVIKTSEKKSNRYIKKKVFSGRMPAVKNLKNDKEVINFIKNNPKSIGFVDDASISGSVKKIN